MRCDRTGTDDRGSASPEHVVGDLEVLCYNRCTERLGVEG